MAVATLRNLQVGVVLGRGEMPVRLTAALQVSLSLFLQILQQTVVVELTVIAVNTGNLGFEVCHIAFGETAHHIQFAQFSLLLTLGKFQYRVDALLLGIGDESARVDHGNLALRTGGIVGAVEAVLLHHSHQPLRIHQILGASECDNIYLIFLQNILLIRS